MRWLQYRFHRQVDPSTVVSLSSTVVIYFIYIYIFILNLMIGLWVSVLEAERLIILSLVRGVTIDGVWIREWIYWPRLISTSKYSATANLHRSPQHKLSLFQPAVSSPAVSWHRLLTVEILQLPSQIPIQNCLSTDRVENTVHSHMLTVFLHREKVFTEPLHRNCISHDRCIATAIRATMYNNVTCLSTSDTNLSRVRVSVTINVVAAYEAGLLDGSFTITITTTTSTLAYLLRDDATWLVHLSDDSHHSILNSSDSLALPRLGLLGWLTSSYLVSSPWSRFFAYRIGDSQRWLAYPLLRELNSSVSLG
jgi:hypothetical protein